MDRRQAHHDRAESSRQSASQWHATRRRPMVPVRRISLFRREVIEHISPTGFELLLGRAERLSEGQIGGTDRFFGSTMLTIDLSKMGERLRETCDIQSALRLAGQLEREPWALGRAAQIAVGEARRLAGRPLGRIETDARVRVDGSRLFIDIDVEAQVAAAGRPAGAC